MKELKDRRVRSMCKLSEVIMQTLVQIDVGATLLKDTDIVEVLDYVRDQLDSEEELKLLRAIEHYINSVSY